MSRSRTRTAAVKRPKVKVLPLAHADGLPLPSYQTADAAGMDLVAAVPIDAPMTLSPGARALIPTGLIFEVPKGHEAQVRPRSGLAIKSGVTVLNSPGTIDADYRGEVSVILINLGSEAFIIKRGDRIAQMVIAPVTQVSVRAARAVSATERGAGGFGSTGTSTAKTPGAAQSASSASPKARKSKAMPKSAPGKKRRAR